MASINILRQENPKCIEWNLKQKSDTPLTSDNFSFQDYICHLEFSSNVGGSKDGKHTFNSQLHLFCNKLLESPVKIAVHVLLDCTTLQTRTESTIKALSPSRVIIWSYSGSSLTGRLLTFEINIYSNISKNPVIMPMCMESLSEDFGKLLENRKHSDVVLKCGEETFQAHRFILSARSDVFSAMFQNKISDSESGIVTIEDMQPKILDYFLRYVYSGKLEVVNTDIAINLYKAAHKYKMSSLKRKCASLIETRFTEDNICSILLIADKYRDKDLSEAAMVYAVSKKSFLKSDKWDAFSEEHHYLALKVLKKFVKK